jgi:hypothetical protein
MKPHETHKTAFCQSLPWRVRIEWFDLTGLVSIDPERHAKLTLTEAGVVGDYIGFRVEIQSKRTGPLDQKLFRFSDYMNSRRIGLSKRETRAEAGSVGAHGADNGPLRQLATRSM